MGQWSNDPVAKASAVVDFSLNPLTAAAGARAVPGLVLPAGAHVTGVYLKVRTPEGGTLGIDIGDDLPTADPDGYIANADGNTAGITVTGGAFATTVNGQGRPITAACNITIDVDNDADAAVVEVIVYARLPGN